MQKRLIVKWQVIESGHERCSFDLRVGAEVLCFLDSNRISLIIFYTTVDAITLCMRCELFEFYVNGESYFLWKYIFHIKLKHFFKQTLNASYVWFVMI